MKIYGPYKDQAKPKGQNRWYLSYHAPRLNDDGTLVLDERGKPRLHRHRPYCKTEAAATADKTRILRQYATAGTGDFVLNREAAADYEEARQVDGDKVKLVDVARFWRRHHPDVAKQRLSDLISEFLAVIKLNLGEGRHWQDLKSRLTQFGTVFGIRYPDTVTRADIMNYVTRLTNQDGSDAQPRTRRNHKTAICNLYSRHGLRCLGASTSKVARRERKEMKCVCT